MLSLKKLNAIFLFMFLAISPWITPNNAFADDLRVQHLDGSWDGKTIPKNGVCLRRGGEGFSPKIGISMIPEKTKSIRLMFTDLNYGKEGGHGGIETKINGESEITVPSFRDNLPTGFKGIKKHHCKKCREIGGSHYYNGPCSPQSKHTYKVFVYARDNNGKTLVKGSLVLGKY